MTDETMNHEPASATINDEPCPVQGCGRLGSEHTPKEQNACDIAWLEWRIADLNRSYDEERARLIDDGHYLGEGELNGSDRDELKELEFERSMELDELRSDLRELRGGDQVAEQEAER